MPSGTVADVTGKSVYRTEDHTEVLVLTYKNFLKNCGIMNNTGSP